LFSVGGGVTVRAVITINFHFHVKGCDMAQGIAEILAKLDVVDQKVEAVKAIVLNAQQADLTPIGDRVDQVAANLDAIVRAGQA
jgi:hypothetical protein